MVTSKKRSKRSDSTSSSATSISEESPLKLGIDLEEFGYKQILVVGFSTKAKEDFDRWMAFEPDKRLVDPDKIRASIDEKRAKAEAEAETEPLLANLLDVYLWKLSLDSNPREQAFSGDDLFGIWDFIAGDGGAGWSRCRAGVMGYSSAQSPPLIYGFNAKLFCKTLAFNLFQTRGWEGRRVPIGFWKDNRDVFDPMLDLTGRSASDSKIPVSDILDRVGVSWEGKEEYGPFLPHMDAKQDCHMCLQLMLRYQLLPFKRTQ